MIIFLQKSTSSSSSIAFFFFEKNEINLKKEEEKVFWAAIPYYLKRKKGLRYLIIEHKKLITISGIASWRNFFSPLIVFEMKKGGKFFGEKTRWNWKDLLDKNNINSKKRIKFIYSIEIASSIME